MQISYSLFFSKSKFMSYYLVVILKIKIRKIEYYCDTMNTCIENNKELEEIKHANVSNLKKKSFFLKKGK